MNTDNNLKSKKIKSNPTTFKLPRINLTSGKPIKYKLLKPFKSTKILSKKKILKKILKKDIEMVNNLNINKKIPEMQYKEMEYQHLKDLIDRNPDIKAKRLGTYKEGKPNDEFGNKIESKERVKYIEKQYANDIKKYQEIKDESSRLDSHILNLSNIIEDYNVELYVLENYKSELLKNFLEKQEMTKNNLTKLINENADNINVLENYQNQLTDLENMNNIQIFDNEIQKKIENINENLKSTKDLLIKFIDDKNNKKNECDSIREKLKDDKNDLIKLYHISLYEGLDFRHEGLSNVIRGIWNLGAEVDLKYMPTYLDNLSKEYLFKHSQQYMQIDNLKKRISESNTRFNTVLLDWKKNCEYFDQSKNSSDVGLFQTRVKKDEKYPKSKKFMRNYYNKNKHLIENEKKNDGFNQLKKSTSLENLKLPVQFYDENRNIEKLKYQLQNLQEKMKNGERDEIRRLCKEFINNNYGEIYQVCPYIIVSAICGDDNKEEGMLFYNKTEKDIIESKKLIQYYNIKQK